MPPARKVQLYPQSCGACALLCAAIELGVTRLQNLGFGPQPAYLAGLTYQGMAANGWNGQALQTTDICEHAIYYITTGGTLRGYSLPSGVCRAAFALGLDVTVYLGSGFRRLIFLGALPTHYPNEIRDVQAMGVTVHYSAYNRLAPNQRALSVLVRGTLFNPGGLHYVMRRPDGSFMDPDTGSDHTWWTFVYHTRPGTRETIKTMYSGVSVVVSG